MAKEKKLTLKLTKTHPRKGFRIGRHVITLKATEFSLNESEQKELKSKGAQAWVAEVKKERKSAKAETAQEKKG